MVHQEFDSPFELRDAIQCFWYNRRDTDEESASFDVIPDGYTELIFHFGGGCSLLTEEGFQPLPSPFLMGLLNQPATFQATSRLEIIGIRCFPWTIFDLLGLPPDQEGVRLADHPIAQLQSTLHELIEVGKVDEAIGQVRQYFLQEREGTATDSRLTKAGAAMKESNGTLPVSQVATAAHTTVRTLERKFKQSSGHTVKDVSGLMRFEQVRNHLWLDPDVNLAGLAHELGYTDQAHLSRDFKRYSGSTPAAFARKVRGNNR
jgi:AraC-like DNA-binding protein